MSLRTDTYENYTTFKWQICKEAINLCHKDKNISFSKESIKKHIASVFEKRNKIYKAVENN